MAKSFENLDNILRELTQKKVEKSLFEAGRGKQRNRLGKILEQSQSSEIKRNTKWMLKAMNLL